MKIAVLSRDPELYSTKRLVEAGLEKGIEMVVLDHLRCNIVMEGNNPQVYYGTKKLQDIDAVLPRIGSSVTFYGATVLKQFEMMGVFTPVSSAALNLSGNKLSSLQRLSKYGIGIPNTVFTDYVSDMGHMKSILANPPWIIKLLDGTHGLGVVLAETQSAAESVIEAFHKLKARMIVQEFISEASGTDVRAFVVDGEIVGAIKRTAKSGFRSSASRGGTAEVIELTEAEKQTVLASVNAIGLGIAGVDLLQSERGPLVIEVNSSPELEKIEAVTQVDIAAKIIEYISKKVVDGV